MKFDFYLFSLGKKIKKEKLTGSFEKDLQQRLNSLQVNWLTENFEAAVDFTLSSQTIYSCHLNHCKNINVAPTSRGGLDEMITSVFPNIRRSYEEHR